MTTHIIVSMNAWLVYKKLFNVYCILASCYIRLTLNICSLVRQCECVTMTDQRTNIQYYLTCLWEFRRILNPTSHRCKLARLTSDRAERASGVQSPLKTLSNARKCGTSGTTWDAAGLRHTGLPVSVWPTTKPPRAARSGSSGHEHRLTTARNRFT
jgi:hypothetical protein